MPPLPSLYDYSRDFPSQSLFIAWNPLNTYDTLNYFIPEKKSENYEFQGKKWSMEQNRELRNRFKKKIISKNSLLVGNNKTGVLP